MRFDVLTAMNMKVSVFWDDIKTAWGHRPEDSLTVLSDTVWL